MPNPSVPNLTRMRENDPIGFDDSWSTRHGTGASQTPTGPAAIDVAMGTSAANGTGITMPTGQAASPNVSNEPKR